MVIQKEKRKENKLQNYRCNRIETNLEEYKAMRNETQSDTSSKRKSLETIQSNTKSSKAYHDRDMAQTKGHKRKTKQSDQKAKIFC